MNFPPDPLLDQIALALVPGIGPKTQEKLLNIFGSASMVLRASSSEWRKVPGVGPKVVSGLRQAQSHEEAKAEWQRCVAAGVQLVARTDSQYPELLRQISAPPSFLYYQGALLPRDQQAIAIIGSRHATTYGLRQAERLAAGLARAGFTIISGLARGIDAAAHRGALEAGGRTIAVLGNGLGHLYPPEHGPLSKEIVQQGALLSENSFLTVPSKTTFPQRNRIISGLSLGILVVEARKRSGALITACHAVDQNREVFAVPGPIDREESEGCHQLIQDGAKLVTGVEDILAELTQWDFVSESNVETNPSQPEAGSFSKRTNEADTSRSRQSAPSRTRSKPAAPSTKTKSPPIPADASPEEKAILQAVDGEALFIDELPQKTGLSMPQLLPILSILEIKRQIKRVDGQKIVRYQA
ncbi:Rossmann fold nucleotide-binding protein Smf [Planctomycetales bacterium 10988]|nr:Rossmann fold nucleotide-binding protein Smf [Planctomycetales bacterium 10988]